MVDLIDPMKNASDPTGSLVPFTIAVPDPVLDDLKRRLDATRFPE